MKVTDVVRHVPRSKADHPFASARGWPYPTRASRIVEIRTDEGITGWGERCGPTARRRYESARPTGSDIGRPHREEPP